MNRAAGLREQELLQRLGWFIRIRWAFAFFIIAVTLISINIFALTIETLPVSIIALSIAIYNAGFQLHIRQINHYPAVPTLSYARRLAISQSVLDIISLTILIHFTGGAENPFVFYFIFHTILTGMLLSKRESYLQAGAVSLLIVGLFILEYSGIVQHHSVKEFAGADLYRNPAYTAAISFVFASTIFIAAYFTASISERLAMREKEIEDANLKLMERDRIKDEYVKMVSHDLKSPLASILSLLEVLRGGFTGQVDEKIKEVIERIYKKIEFLHHYTKDLLDLSRIRAERQLKLQTFDIADVIDAAVEIAMPKMGEKKIELVREIPDDLPPLEADREQITYVFLNLIANAFKYTPSGGKVWIRVVEKNGSIMAEVKDTGIGIPSEDIHHLFEEFFRASNVARTTKGTGLGLSLAKYIVERHSGAISVESVLEKGSTFRVVLPIQQPKP